MAMQFRFSDFQAFMWMDGHGPYVWACYLITFACLIFLIIEPMVQRKRFIQQQKRVAATQQPLQSEEG